MYFSKFSGYSHSNTSAGAVPGHVVMDGQAGIMPGLEPASRKKGLLEDGTLLGWVE
jgi:hypothetical protein